jgi:hypothetical protein
MNKFYIAVNGQKTGPFSYDELKTKGIHRDTLIWTEGIDNWTKAEHVALVKDIIVSTPPPIPKEEKKQEQRTEPKVTFADNTVAETKTKKKRRNIIIIIFSALIVIYGTYSYLSEQAKVERQLEEQNAKIQEQERIEDARKADAAKQQRTRDLAKLKYQYDNAVTTLRSEKLTLNEIEQFQFLRTSDEKQQQVKRQLQIIRSWENEVTRAKQALEQY